MAFSLPCLNILCCRRCPMRVTCCMCCRAASEGTSRRAPGGCAPSPPLSGYGTSCRGAAGGHDTGCLTIRQDPPPSSRSGLQHGSTPCHAPYRLRWWARQTTWHAWLSVRRLSPASRWCGWPSSPSCPQPTATAMTGAARNRFASTARHDHFLAKRLRSPAAQTHRCTVEASLQEAARSRSTRGVYKLKHHKPC